MTVWRLEFAGADGTQGSVELEIPPTGQARYELHL